VQRHLQDARLHLGRDRGRATRSWRILLQRLDPALQEAASPQRHLTTIQADLGGDVLVLPALSGQQHDAGSLLNSRLDAAPLGKNKQCAVVSSLIVSATRIAPAAWAVGVCREKQVL
jgi:hypothetical protein